MSISVNPINYSCAIARPLATVSGTVMAAASRPLAAITVQRDSVSLSASAHQAFGLSQIGAALEAPARISNSLATADQGLSTLGNLLGNIHSTLTASQPHTLAEDQSSIDSALSTLDRVSAATTFGGRKLLDGSYTASLNGATLSLPSFISTKLGSSSASSLASIATGGEHALRASSGAATGIVSAALDQVTSARQQIAEFQTDAIQPLTDAGQSAMEHLIAAPVIDDSSAAASNAVLTRARVLLQPESTLNALAPDATHVLQLLRG